MGINKPYVPLPPTSDINHQYVRSLLSLKSYGIEDTCDQNDPYKLGPTSRCPNIRVFYEFILCHEPDLLSTLESKSAMNLPVSAFIPSSTAFMESFPIDVITEKTKYFIKTM